ncbi:MAG: hypothetical protein ACTSRE_07370 [Promethearchaeota archaeon]
MNKKNLGILALVGLIFGIISLVFSILIYELDLFSSFWSFCSSPCTIWPGIPVSEVCILMCEYRSYLYFPFLAIGFLSLVSAIIAFRYRKRF